MDHPLTPGKIKRLINFAEDRCPQFQRLTLENRKQISRLGPEQAYLLANIQYQDALRNTTATADCSSGLLDLERVEGFGDSADGSVYMSKSTAFNPGEMTGRSTEADDVEMKRPLYGRHSMTIESIERKMNKQTSDVVDTMRYSICTDATFHSRRDLTADEASFASKGNALQYHTMTRFTDVNNTCDKMDGTGGNMSVGAYFQNRCEDIHKMLNKIESPDRSMAPSITEVSNIPTTPLQSLHSYSVDPMLDSIPVRQPRVPEIQQVNNNLKTSIPQEKQVRTGDLDKAVTINICDPKHKVDKLSKTLFCMNAPQPCRMLNTTSKANELLKKTLQSSMKIPTSDESCALDTENSISLSKIADYLGGKQSNISVTELLNKHKSNANKKQPLTEVQLNVQPLSRLKDDDVVYLKDTKKTETASSMNTINTVICLEKFNVNNIKIPEVIITKNSLDKDIFDDSNVKKRATKSKSPSTKSQSTLSTVQENCLSFKSGDSPLQSSRGEDNPQNIPSQIEYRELDKSVDWHDVMQHKCYRHHSFGKENWVEIITKSCEGFVGVSCPITISVTTLSESWLTASLKFDDLPDNGVNLSIELPRFPILLSPGNTEKITIHITSSAEMDTTLPFTVSLKDVSIDSEIEQKGDLQIKFNMPSIQAISSDGVNKISFPETHENNSLVKSMVLFSDCAVDLQLAISIAEGDSVFSIKNIQEIKKADINKILMERSCSVDDHQGKTKNKSMNKQLCKLSNGNAIKVSLRFNAPELGDLRDPRTLTSFTGTLHVNLIGINTLLKKFDIIGFVGYTHLDFIMTFNKLQLGKVPTNLTLSNIGNMTGSWIMKYKCNSPDENFPFEISPNSFKLQPGSSVDISFTYTGPDDVVTESKISFEEVKSGKRTSLDLVGGTEKPKIFPIKTNRSTLSWVRSGRKELSLKNSTNKKVQIRCSIIGEGFSLDMPGIDSTRSGAYCLNFGPLERRSLPIIFAPSTNLPHAATLHVVIDKNSEFTRKVRLFGCAASEGVRWFSQVTYGDTALVRAASRAPIKLELFNKSNSSAFICAQVHFNLQFRALESTASVMGARRVIGSRAKHAIVVNVEWARVEAQVRAREAPATGLATITVLTGHEYTRRRILKVLKDRSGGEIDTSPLPAHLTVLADIFVGEDPEFDLKIEDFNETEASLTELLSGLQELTAQVDLPQDFAEDNTIIISDDTVLEHHTLHE